MKIRVRYPLFVLLLLLSIGSFAQTVTSSQDGNWEDSSTWSNNKPLGDILDGDTIIIRHHINFNDNLLFSNSYLQIDSSGSLCGHDSVHFYISRLLEYGGFYAEHVLVEKSQWDCYHGYWVIAKSMRSTGAGSYVKVCCGCGGHVGGGFICTIPVQSWKDTTQTDPTEEIQTDTAQTDSTIIPLPKLPVSIVVYPNPSHDHFIVDSDIPGDVAPVTLKVYDVLGRKMKSVSIPEGKSSLTMFTQNWAPGMYIMRFEHEDQILQIIKWVRAQ